MRASRPLSTLVIFAAALGLCLSLATAALAADGVRVIPSPVATPVPGQLEPAISGDYLAYTSTNPVAALSDQSSIALKYLGDAGRPTIIPTPDFAPVGTPDYKDMQPSIAVDGSKIYVVWTRIRLPNLGTPTSGSGRASTACLWPGASPRSSRMTATRGSWWRVPTSIRCPRRTRPPSAWPHGTASST